MVKTTFPAPIFYTMDNQEFTFKGTFSPDFKSIELEASGTFRRALYYLEGIDLEVRVRKLSRKRTDAQNRYWWGVLIQAVVAYARERRGESITPAEAHLWVVTKILKSKVSVKPILGSDIIMIEAKSTSEMSTKEFSEAVDEVRLYFDDPTNPENPNWPIPLPTKFNLYHEFQKQS